MEKLINWSELSRFITKGDLHGAWIGFAAAKQNTKSNHIKTNEMKIKMTLQETKQIYKEMLDEKKTLRSKKIWLKKWLKECQDQLSAYQTAYARKFGDRWYLGEQINSLDIRQTEREIDIINEITATL